VSNIFAPLVRPYGTLPVLIESGPAIGTDYMHMKVGDNGYLLCSHDLIHHYGAAVPFDIYGRVVISAAAVVRWDQGIPFTAGGAVAMQEAEDVAHWDQGLTFLDTGHIATGGKAPDPVAPIWSEIPPQDNFLYELPQSFDASAYVSDGGLPITSFNLITPPDFFTISNSGVVTAGVGTPDAAHVLTIEACNDIGCTTTTMIWDLATGNVPTWEPIPPQQHRINELPKTLNAGPYASSDSGPILTLSLVSPPPGITMSGSVIIVAAGTAVNSYVLTVRATNGVGAGDTTFTWDILEELIAPVWSSIPGKINTTNDLPVPYDVSPYVTSNAGVLRNWLLITPPPGFTIDQSGVVTAAVGTVVAAHSIVVQVENDIGASTSSFTWTLSDQLLPPQWQTIPGQSDPENTLPTTLDVSGFVSSNDGPLTSWALVTPQPGFTISAAGVITVAAGTVVGNYSIAVEVTNDTGTTASAPFNWEITLFYLAPEWGQIAPKVTAENVLPVPYDVSGYVISNSGALTGWAIVTPPIGFTIDGAGVITAASGVSPGTYPLTVSVTNDTGTTSSAPFNWTVTLFYTAPEWSTIPPQTTPENLLAAVLDVTPYVTSNSGPLVTWTLVAPPTGFSINGSGVITAAGGTAVGVYSLTVEVTNDTGTTQSAAFNWEVTLFYLVPQWQTIPAQTNGDDDLPVTLDTAPFVTSNSGALTNWSLVSPPSGFSIDAAGVITVAPGTLETIHSIVVRVSNDEGSADSASFNWTITDVLLPPVWDTVSDQNTSEQNLPAFLDLSVFVSSNDGALTGWELVSPPAGISISQSGLITVVSGLAPGGYSLQARVSNNSGQTASNVFTWTVAAFYTPPVWITVPDQSISEELLPDTLDLNPYVSSNDGPLTSWSLLQGPPGASINSGGVVTIPAGVDPGAYQVQARVSNNNSSADSVAFQWTIGSFYLPPVWSAAPSNRTTDEDVLPTTKSQGLNVTSNHGALFGWYLTPVISGFTIDNSAANGRVTAAAGIAPGAYVMKVGVSNSSGTTESDNFTWTINSVYLPPVWITIPPQSTEEQLLPVVLDVTPYVSSNNGPLTGWSLVSPPAGWTISQSGIITAAISRPVGNYSITVRVDNASGSTDSASFAWDILEEPLPPQWSTIPGRSDRENTLPQTYDVSPFVSSNSGALTGWALITPPSGFSISGTGVITAADGTTVAGHSLTVRVSNDEGSNDATFTWTILEELLPPQWGTIPNQSDRINTLPETLDTSLYVTSNSGSLVLWRLASAPSGFSINSSTGLVTAAASAGVGNHSVRVGVTNAEGESLSNTFTWTILEELLPPQWSTIPNRSDDASTLPQNYDVSGYVTSNSGSLDTWSLTSNPGGYSINQSGVITAATNAVTGTVTVRVYNDTGNSSKSFTWTIVADDTEDLTEFNAVLGNWNFYRAGSAWGYDKNDSDHEVGTDVPIYVGCGWSGSAFTPDSGFLGIRIDPESTNSVDYSTDITAAGWTNSFALSTSVTFSPRGDGGSNNAFTYQIDSATTQTFVMSTYHRLEVAINGAIYISNDGSTKVHQYFPDSSLQRAIGPQWTSNTQYPMHVSVATAGRVHVKYIQIEEEGFDGATGPIKTGSSPVTRNQDGLYAENSDFGWDANACSQGFCGQVKFRSHFQEGSSTWIQLYMLVSGLSPSETNYVTIWQVDGEIRFGIYQGGSAVRRLDMPVTMTNEGDYEMKFRCDPDVGLRLWLTGTGISDKDVTLNGTFSDLANTYHDMHKFGNWYEDNQTGSGSFTVKSIRINRTVLSDAEIEAWT
jgi:hypothetical protein